MLRSGNRGAYDDCVAAKVPPDRPYRKAMSYPLTMQRHWGHYSPSILKKNKPNQLPCLKRIRNGILPADPDPRTAHKVCASSTVQPNPHNGASVSRQKV